MSGDREESLEERRARLNAELSARHASTRGEEEAERKAEDNRKGYAQAMKISSEFISAIFVGAVLGYLLDHFAGTSPWGLIIFLLLGFCAGVLNVLRVVGMVASPHPADRVAKLKEKGEDR